MRAAHLREPHLPADHDHADRLAGVRGDAGALRPRRAAASTTSSCSTRRRRPNALDFLEAPQRIAAAVSSPALQWFARPPDEGGRGFRCSGCARAARWWCAGWPSSSAASSSTTSGAFLVDFQRRAGRLPRARAARSRAAARPGRRLPAGAGARGGRGRRGALLPRRGCARPASRWAASSPTACTRRRATMTRPHRAAPARPASGGAARRERAARGGARWRRRRTLSRRCARRSGASWSGWRATRPVCR